MGGNSLGKAYVQIVPSADGIKGSVSSVLNGEVSSAGETGGSTLGSKIGSFAKKAIAAAAVGKFIVASIKEGAEYEQNKGGIDKIFGESADKMIQYANDAWKTAGISANDYMSQATSFSQSLLQSLGGDQAKAAEAANQAIIDMSDNANTFGTDIADIQNAYQGFAKQNFTMLDNLKLGYGGTKTEMQRLLADAEKVSGVHYDISNLNDIYSAIHVIQEETNIAGTTAKEAASTISGSFNSMKSAAQNFMAQLVNGEDINESLSAMVDSAGVFLVENLLPAVVDIVVNLATQLPDLLNKLTDKILEWCDGPEMGEAGGNIIIKLGEAMVKCIPALLKLVGAIITALFNAFDSLMQTLWDAISGWIETKFAAIKQKINLKLLMLKLTIQAKFLSIKLAILTPIYEARDKIRAVIAKIKEFFNFKVSLPNIKLPHFSIKPAGWKLGDLLKGTIPSLGIKWYAKGGIFSQPTVAGIGEAGPEAVVPLNKLWNRLDAMSDDIVSGVRTASMLGSNNSQPIEIVVELGGARVGSKIVELYDRSKLALG